VNPPCLPGTWQTPPCHVGGWPSVVERLHTCHDVLVMLQSIRHYDRLLASRVSRTHVPASVVCSFIVAVFTGTSAKRPHFQSIVSLSFIIQTSQVTVTPRCGTETCALAPCSPLNLAAPMASFVHESFSPAKTDEQPWHCCCMTTMSEYYC
jgi:hypothetical protein